MKAIQFLILKIKYFECLSTERETDRAFIQRLNNQKRLIIKHLSTLNILTFYHD